MVTDGSGSERQAQWRQMGSYTSKQAQKHNHQHVSAAGKQFNTNTTPFINYQFIRNKQQILCFHFTVQKTAGKRLETEIYSQSVRSNLKLNQQMR